MNEQRRTGRDRRSEPRYAVAGRLVWKSPDSDRMHTGLLSDMSEAGISFVTRDTRSLRVGDEIQVSTVAENGCAHCVTRLAPYGGSEILVGCRMAAETNRA